MDTLKQIVPLIGIKIDQFNEYDYESIIYNFWMHSVTHRIKEFDFSNAFDSLKGPIENKLSEHGLLDYESFKDNEDEFYDYSILNNLVHQTNHISIDCDDLKEVIIKYKYNRNKETFEGYGSFEELKDILEDIKNHYGHSTQWKNCLFDRIIHAHHETGDIFDGVNIDNLREQAEDNIKEL